MADGVLVMDKPQGWTSMDVCAKLRGVLHERRVGHGGTLDPMATGVLPVFVGRATRAAEFSAEGEKEYLAALELGVVTNTQDRTGTVLEEREVRVDRDALETALEGFRGEIRQLPPMYSAIKRGGVKLYELARKGREVERESRRVTISCLEIVERETVPQDFPAGENLWYLRVRCSKGTYVRTLCHDVGAALGCGGTMSALRRTRAGGFTLEEAVTMTDLLRAAEEGRAESLLRGVDGCFAQYPALEVKGEGEKRVRNGAPLPCEREEGLYRVYSGRGEFLMLGEVAAGRLKVRKSFFTP